MKKKRVLPRHDAGAVLDVLEALKKEYPVGAYCEICLDFLQMCLPAKRFMFFVKYTTEEQFLHLLKDTGWLFVRSSGMRSYVIQRIT